MEIKWERTTNGFYLRIRDMGNPEFPHWRRAARIKRTNRGWYTYVFSNISLYAYRSLGPCETAEEAQAMAIVNIRLEGLP
jgi:hypothetical protein